jgi:hypothetical protein
MVDAAKPSDFSERWIAVGGSAAASAYKAFCGHGMPASPQREAVGLKLMSSDCRTSSEKRSAKLPSMRKTIIRRVTGNRQVSTG